MSRVRWLSETGACITCGGTGELRRASDGIEHWEVQCSDCKGTGRKPEPKKTKQSKQYNSDVAQQVEHEAHNFGGVGSIPTVTTNFVDEQYRHLRGVI